MKKRWVFLFLILVLFCFGCKSNKSQNTDKKDNQQKTESEGWSETTEIPGVGEVEISIADDVEEEEQTVSDKEGVNVQNPEDESENPSNKIEDDTPSDRTENDDTPDNTEEEKPSEEKEPTPTEKWTEGYY